MDNRLIWRRLITLLTIISIIVCTFYNSVKADVIDESTSSKVIRIDGEAVLTITMSVGAITIVAKSKAATSNIRWKTVGLTITRTALNPNGAYARGISGPSDVSTVYSSGKGELMFDKAVEKTDSLPVNGIVTTTIKFSAKQVEEALEADFDDIKQNTLIYLHGIFTTYNNETGIPRSSELKNWKDIVNKEAWGMDTVNDFDKYFNMPIEFQPATYQNYLHYITESKVELKDNKALGEIKSGKPLSWSNEPTTLLNDYQLIGSYVSKRGKNETREAKYVDDGWDQSKIRSGSTTVLMGGMDVYLVYRKKVPTSYEYNAVAIDTDGNYLRHLTSERVSVKEGDIVTYDPVDNFTQSAKEYKFQNQWYLKYKDKSGVVQSSGVKVATKVNNYTMPAAQNASLATFYFIYDTTQGVPTPPPEVPEAPTPTPAPALDEVVAPPYDSAYSEFTKAVTTGEIRADDRGSEKFTATLGVPTTESLYGQVRAKEYLLGYFFEKKVGIKHYSVRVSKSYSLSWKSAAPPGSKEEGKIQTETVTVTQYISVPRAYGYWQIINLDYYTINKAVLRNYALPDGSLIITPNGMHYNPPSINYTNETSEAYHIIPPNEAVNGITLPSQSIAGGTSKPSIPQEDFSYTALSQTGKCKVRSDSLVFDGQTVISGEITETEAPNINTDVIPQCTTFTNQNALYKNDQVILATKKNGVYGSSGTITYYGRVRIGSSITQEANYPIADINDVVIHTPVICDPIVTADNDKWVQLIKPTEGCVQLVLDPDPELSDFYIKVSNTGFHTGIAGYFTRDFSRSLHDNIASYLAEKSGLLRNEVKFPFDVFVDIGGDKDQKNDDYIKAGTWVTLGRATARFYLPTWTTEGVYTVNFRTVAVNGDDKIDDTEVYANRNRLNYVATNTVKMEVSGRIYGLTIYDLSDYPIWKTVFRKPNSSIFKKDSSGYTDGTSKTNYNKNYYYTYKVGTNDQYGNDTGRSVKYTFPLINGSHPYYKNQGILKTGYLVRFSLDTIGDLYSDGASVVILPAFYFVDKSGKNRKAVDLYYQEEINGKSRSLVKVGGSLDAINVKSYNTGDLNLSIPKTEMKLTAALRNTMYNRFFWQRSGMFTFAKIQLNYPFRTLVGQNYTAKIKRLESFPQVLAAGITTSKSDKSMQRWYGQYYIPNNVHIAPKGYDVMDYADKYGIDYEEDFWLTDGYIIVNLNIYTINENKEQRLSYVNASNHKNNGNCSMWVMENPPLSKTSYKGPAFSFYAGDFCMFYGNKSASSDYSPGAIY